MGQRQQRIRLRIIGGDRSARDVVGQRREAAEPPFHVVIAQGVNFDERLGSDASRRHVVLVHKDDGPRAVDPPIAIIHAVDRRVVLVVAAYGRQAQHFWMWAGRIFVDPAKHEKPSLTGGGSPDPFRSAVG